MSEYRIHQDINLFEIADGYAKRLQEHVDELALDMAAETLAKYGYVKVVRCRDCSWFCEGSEVHVTYDWCQNFDCETNEDGYCAWSERRADA